MSYRFKVWNKDRKEINYCAFVGYDKYGFSEMAELEVKSYNEAVKLKKKLKRFYIAGRGWNVSNPDKYLKTLCWPN